MPWSGVASGDGGGRGRGAPRAARSAELRRRRSVLRRGARAHRARPARDAGRDARRDVARVARAQGAGLFGRAGPDPAPRLGEPASPVGGDLRGGRVEPGARGGALDRPVGLHREDPARRARASGALGARRACAGRVAAVASASSSAGSADAAARRRAPAAAGGRAFIAGADRASRSLRPRAPAGALSPVFTPGSSASRPPASSPTATSSPTSASTRQASSLRRFDFSVHTTPDTTISASQGTGSGTFSWTYGRAEACPIKLTIATRLAARPCVPLDVGAVSAGGNGEVNTSSHIRAWAAVGGLARLDWTLPLQGNTAAVLELQGGVAFPLVREDFQFQPSTPVYQAPVAAGLAGLGVGLRFP